MVSNVGRIPNPAYGRSAGFMSSRPLAERFSEALSWALKEIPPGEPEREGLPSMMLDELSIDHFHEAVQQFKARKYKPTPPELQSAWDEMLGVQRSINSGITRFNETIKRWLWRAQQSWKHKLLKSWRADFATPLELENLEWDTRLYPDVPSTKKAIKEKEARLVHVEELNSLASNGESFDELPVELQSEHLCRALYDELVVVKERLARVEGLSIKPKSSNSEKVA